MFRKYKINYKHISLIFITLKYRFLKEKNNVISVFYIFNKVNYFLISHFFNIIRLSLTYFNKNIYFYINVFFYVYIFFSLNYFI